MKPAFSPSLGTFEGGERGGNCSGLKQTSWNIRGEKKWKNWIWKKWKQNFSVAYNSKTWRSKTRSIGRMGFQSFWDFYLPCKDYWLSWDLMALYQGAWETSCFASEAFVPGSAWAIWHWIWQAPTLPLVNGWDCCIPMDVLIHWKQLFFSNNKILCWYVFFHNYDVPNHKNGRHILTTVVFSFFFL